MAYALATSFMGESLLSGFNWFDGSDPTHGFVSYQSRPNAEAKGLFSVDDATGVVRLGLDHTNVISNGAGRPSIRLESKEAFNHGLFIADFLHMPPSQCGMWPAFWLYGDNWPSGGEVDIIEGVNTAHLNSIAGHTSSGCTLDSWSEGQYSGVKQRSDCSTGSDNIGCGYGSPANATTSYGDGFNAVNGGVYAVDWTAEYIKVWHFERGQVPADIEAKKPDPSTWSVPVAAFGGSSCAVDQFFKNMRLVINTNFCGDWGDAVWGKSDQCNAFAPTCSDYVAKTPEAFANAYWDVRYIDTYQWSEQGRLAEPDSVKTASSQPGAATNVPSIAEPTTEISPEGTSSEGLADPTAASFPYTQPETPDGPSSSQTEASADPTSSKVKAPIKFTSPQPEDSAQAASPPGSSADPASSELAPNAHLQSQPETAARPLSEPGAITKAALGFIASPQGARLKPQAARKTLARLKYAIKAASGPQIPWSHAPSAMSNERVANSTSLAANKTSSGMNGLGSAMAAGSPNLQPAVERPANPAKIGKAAYLGCFGSRSGFQTFQMVEKNRGMTLERCVGLCKEKTMAGIFEGQCFCAEALDADTRAMGPDEGAECNHPCPGNADQFCGGIRDSGPGMNESSPMLQEPQHFTNATARRRFMRAPARRLHRRKLPTSYLLSVYGDVTDPIKPDDISPPPPPLAFGGTAMRPVVRVTATAYRTVYPLQATTGTSTKGSKPLATGAAAEMAVRPFALDNKSKATMNVSTPLSTAEQTPAAVISMTTAAAVVATPSIVTVYIKECDSKLEKESGRPANPEPTADMSPSRRPQQMAASKGDSRRLLPGTRAHYRPKGSDLSQEDASSATPSGGRDGLGRPDREKVESSAAQNPHERHRSNSSAPGETGDVETPAKLDNLPGNGSLGEDEHPGFSNKTEEPSVDPGVQLPDEAVTPRKGTGNDKAAMVAAGVPRSPNLAQLARALFVTVVAIALTL